MDGNWYFADERGQVGPLNLAQLKIALAKKRNLQGILVWRPGLSSWLRAEDVPELAPNRTPPPLPDQVYVESKNPERTLQPKRLRKTLYAILALILVSVLLRLLGGDQDSASKSAASKSAAPCVNSYTACSDNADMVNNYRKMFDAKWACRREIDDRAKYGTPEWSWITFGQFYKGNDYPKTGLVKIIDDDVKIPNAFGAKARSTVVCWYDFVSGKAVIKSVN